MMKTFSLLSLLSISVTMKIAILYSEIRPSFFFPDTAPFSQILLSTYEQIPLLQTQDFELLYDLTYSAAYSESIYQLSQTSSIHYLKGYEDPRFSLSSTDQVQSIFSLLALLSIKKYAVVYSLDYADFFLPVIQSAEYRTVIEGHTLPNDINLEIHNLKFTEITIIVLLMPALKASNFFQSLSKEIFEGNAWVLAEIADILPFCNTTEGILRLSRANPSFLAEILNIFKACEFEDFYICEKKIEKFDWKILNLVKGQYLEVGHCGEDCVLEDRVFWPNGAEGNEKLKKNLEISYEGSLTDPQGNSLAFLLPAYQGVELGLDYVNNLSDYIGLKAAKLNLGGTYFNRSYVSAYVSQSGQDFGNLMIAPAMSDLSLNVYQFFENNSATIPMLGYSNTVSELSSSIDFPYFLRVCMPDSYVTVLISLMAKYFGWQKIGVLYVDNLFSRTLYQDFLALSHSSGLEILNKQSNMLPADSGLWGKYDQVFVELGQSQARVIIVFCFTNEINLILLKMNELGYSGEQYEYIAVDWLVDELINPRQSHNKSELKIIRSSLKGSLMFFPVSFIDKFGDDVQRSYKAKYSAEPVGYTAFAFDSVLAVYHAFQQMIDKKQDYESSSKFMQALRNVKYLGATGPVTFLQQNNDRSPMDHYILNTRQVSETDWQIEIIGLFSPTSLNVFTFYKNITWPGSGVPLDSPPTYLCPFSPAEVTRNTTGTVVVFVVIFVVFSLVSLSAYFGWNRWAFEANLDLEKKHQMTFVDIMNISKILLEFFQYLGLILSLPLILTIFKSIGNVISLDLESVYLLKPFIFWQVYQGVLVFCAVSIASRVLVIFRCKIPYTEVFCNVSSDLLFVSILSTLSNVYICYESVSDPFLHYDCNMKCWQGVHLIYIAINSVVLVLYCLFMSFEKPRWSSGESVDQHVCISPKHNYIKSIMQAFLVCLKKTVWVLGSKAYTVVMLCCIIAYAVFNIMKRGYNIEILQLWMTLSYLGVAVVCAFSLICEITKSDGSPYWVIATLTSWGVLLMIGLIYQKMKKLTWPFLSNTVDIVLLKFAFQNKKIEWVRRHSSVFQNWNRNENLEENTVRPDWKVPENSLN